ncbi:MAG TPA: metallophosphoesterase family protein [Alphaproteobacteria bacterium]|nr:metallophosphoesterase family protein [Alphaproteobacteria bacterium]
MTTPDNGKLDLGTLEASVLLFGGPYGNREATEALLAEAERRAIPWHRVICTGDVAAYCADPQDCVDLLRARNIATVMGNCEEQLAIDAADCGCGFGEGSACETLSVAWYDYCRRALDHKAKRWMGSLPRRIDFTLGRRRLAVVHGSVSRINRLIFNSTPDVEKAGELDLAASDGVIGGHCGLPFSSLIESEIDIRLWHNAGAIGMPANDGTPRVWFSILTVESDGIRATIEAIHYDHERAARRMREFRLPEGYIDCLASGLWPSCEILPPVERACRGRPIASTSAFWRHRVDDRRPGQSRKAS